MTPEEIIRAEGHTEVKLTDNKEGYQLVRYRSRFCPPSLRGYYRGVIFRHDHSGWQRTRHEGDHETMVTCFYNLTRN
jgi:hypothetical protein